jgi:hypothetical protein
MGNGQWAMGKRSRIVADLVGAACCALLVAACRSSSSEGGTGVPPVSAAAAEPNAQATPLAGGAGNTGGTLVPPEVPDDNAALQALVNQNVVLVGLVNSSRWSKVGEPVIEGKINGVDAAPIWVKFARDSQTERNSV